MRYNNIHKHSHYSNIITPDCVIKPVDLAKRAVELGHTILATTEHGTAGNVFEYYDIAKEYGLKFVFGIEYYYVDDRFSKDKSNTHLMMVARNEEGKRAMTRIMSESYKTGFYHKPRIDKELLLSLNPNDVLVTTACVGSYIGKHDNYEEDFIVPLHNHFGNNFYLEIQDNAHPIQVEYNKKILDLHNKYNIEMFHACDTHYILPEDDKYRDMFLKGKKIFYPDEDGFIMDYPDSDLIFDRYKKQGVFTKEQIEKAINNTLVVDEFEDIVMKKNIKMPSIYPNSSHEEKIDKLKKLLNKKWIEDKVSIPKEKHREHIKGIQFETNIIEDTKMEDYFLLNYEIIKRAKEVYNGVLTKTGRGSAVSFKVNKLLDFTEVDRIEAPITLYPTRFMSKSRILETKSLPDIDFNTADAKPFIQATRDILGEDNCYYMVAYGTMKESSSFRNVCRSHGLKISEYNDVAKNLDKYKNNSKWKKYIDEAKVFEGVIDSISPHSCSCLLLDTPISEDVGVIKIGDEFCAMIDSGTSDVWKFLKNDYLVVTVVEIIDKVFKEINKEQFGTIELENITQNDDKVWNLYRDGMTATLNQTGTQSAIPQVMQYKPKNVSELSAFVAGIRPSFESMKQYLFNRIDFSYGIPEFDALLEDSDNFILYQENIMKALVYAGFEEDVTYGLLKAISKKKEGIIEPIHDKFIEGFTEKTGSKEQAKKVWKIIEDAVGYGFNASHALSVAYDSLYGAYLKANYPLEYFSVVLQIYEGNTKITAQLINELPYFNIKLLPIKFRKSKEDYTYDKEKNFIYKGMASIKFMNNLVSHELYELKDNTYNDFVDLLIDIEENTSANKTQMTILISLNFFDEFGKNKKLLDTYEYFKKRYKKTHIPKTKEKRIAEVKEFYNELKNENILLSDQLKNELEYLGYVQTIDKSINPAYSFVLSVDAKYSPRIELYQISTGKKTTVKVSKSIFYNQLGEQLFGEGDIIEMQHGYKKPKSKKVDGKWVEIGGHDWWMTKFEVKHI